MPGPIESNVAAKRSILGSLAILLAILLPLSVAASHRFTDVPNSNIFHDDITWLADNDITRGCNPPTNTRFCPTQNLTREQMAAFLHRFAGAFGAAGDATDLGTNIPVPQSSDGAEVLSVDVTPEDAATVVLHANISLTKLGSDSGTYQVVIARNSCAGPRLNDGAVWTSAGTDLERTTLSLNAIDTVVGPTTYKVCVNRGVGPEANVTRSAVTASWTPAK